VEVKSGFSDGLATDLEFSYRVRRVPSDTNELGDLILTRQGSYYKCCGYFHGGTISKARIGCDDSANAVYLDVYVENASQAADYAVIVRGFNRTPFLVAPQRVTSTPTVVKETVFKYWYY
jgi:hypothetical protein